MEGARSCYIGGQFNGARIVMLRRWSEWRENGYATEVVSLMQREWSYYRSRGGHFNGGRMVMLQVVTLKEGGSCYGGG